MIFSIFKSGAGVQMNGEEQGLTYYNSHGVLFQIWVCAIK